MLVPRAAAAEYDKRENIVVSPPVSRSPTPVDTEVVVIAGVVLSTPPLRGGVAVSAAPTALVSIEAFEVVVPTTDPVGIGAVAIPANVEDAGGPVKALA